METTEYLTDREIGERIKALRGEHGFSQEQLGELLGLPQYAVSKIETGDRVASARELVALSRAFGVTMAQLVQREMATPPMFGDGDGDGDGVRESLRQFRACIDEFHGVETLVA